MGYIYNSDFVNILVEETCKHELSDNWVTEVSRRGVNLRDKDEYVKWYGKHKAHNISEWLSPMQKIYYRFCLVREIMVGLSTLPLETFEIYIRNVQQNPDSSIKERMNHLFRESRLGSGGVVRMTHHQNIDVGPTNFNITESVLFAIPVEKIRLNFFFNVWEFIYSFKEELDLGLKMEIPTRIININYIFPIFGVPINDVNLFSPTYLKNWMIRIQEETKPLERNRQTSYESDDDVVRVYKEDLLECSILYYKFLKQSVDTLEKELNDLLQKFATEYRDNDTRSTKTPKDPKNRIGPRRNLGGSKTKRKQRRRKQKSRTKKN